MVDTWHSFIEAGKAYCLSGGRIVPAKKNFANVGNDHELTIDKATDIALVRLLLARSHLSSVVDADAGSDGRRLRTTPTCLASRTTL